MELAYYIGNITVLLLLLRAIYTDVKRGKIENVLIVGGLFLGVFIVIMTEGFKGAICSLKIMGIVFVILFPLFLIKGLGAGDIKLFCVLAIFYQRDVFCVLIYSFLSAGFIVLCKMLVRKIKGQKAFIKKEKMAFSIPILIGTLAMIILPVILDRPNISIIF